MRNRRFINAYRREAEKRLEKCVSRLVDRVMAQPVERGFFVSADYVMVMDRRRREGKLPRMSEENARMWREIFGMIDAYLSEHPGAKRTEAVCHLLARGRASRFYISRNVALELAIRGEERMKTHNR